MKICILKFTATHTTHNEFVVPGRCIHYSEKSYKPQNNNTISTQCNANGRSLKWKKVRHRDWSCFSLIPCFMNCITKFNSKKFCDPMTKCIQFDENCFIVRKRKHNLLFVQLSLNESHSFYLFLCRDACIHVKCSWTELYTKYTVWGLSNMKMLLFGRHKSECFRSNRNAFIRLSLLYLLNESKY